MLRPEIQFAACCDRCGPDWWKHSLYVDTFDFAFAPLWPSLSDARDDLRESLYWLLTDKIQVCGVCLFALATEPDLDPTESTEFDALVADLDLPTGPASKAAHR